MCVYVCAVDMPTKGRVYGCFAGIFIFVYYHCSGIYENRDLILLNGLFALKHI